MLFERKIYESKVYNSVKSTGQNKNIETGEISPESTRYPDGKNNYTTIAAYLSYKQNLSEKLTMNLISGLRANYVSIYSTFEDTSSLIFLLIKFLLIAVL